MPSGEPPIDPSSPLGFLNERADPAQPRPPQADDPTRLSNGMVVPRMTPGPVEAGSFSVDLARAPEAIRELEQAHVQLKSLRDEALRLGKIASPAQDEVSRDVASRLGVTATGGDGSLLAALDAGLDRISDLIDALRGDLAGYRTDERTVAATLRATASP